MDEGKTGWRKSEARQAHAAGAIIGYEIVTVEEGFVLRFVMHPALPNKGPVYQIDFRNAKPRVFNSVDTALANAREVGFDTSRITSVSLLPAFAPLSIPTPKRRQKLSGQ